MRTRLTFTVLLAVLLAAPVVASGDYFLDVPENHPHAAAIRYVREEGIYKGFPDGRFRAEESMSDSQFVKVARRLYDRYDEWTRADWAQLLFAGLPSLADDAATTTTTLATTTTTRAAVIEPTTPPVAPPTSRRPNPPPNTGGPTRPITSPPAPTTTAATTTTTTTTLPDVGFQASATWYSEYSTPEWPQCGLAVTAAPPSGDATREYQTRIQTATYDPAIFQENGRFDEHWEDTGAAERLSFVEDDGSDVLPPKGINWLPDREQKILILRFGLNGGKPRTLGEIGQEFKLTRERVRQLLQEALCKLRHPSSRIDP